MNYLNTLKNATFFVFGILLIYISSCNRVQDMVASEPQDAMDAAPIRVSFVYPGDCLGDSSYCDLFHKGAEEVKRNFGAERIEVTEIVSNADTWDMQLQAAAESSDLILTSGYQMAEPVSRVAPEFPEVMFVIFDAAVDLPNVASFTYRVNEGTFLLGAVAGLKTQTGKVGYLGGANVPFLHEFEAGYIAGVKAVNPDAEIISSYVADNEQGFYQPEVAETLALTQYGLGVDVIYTMADQSGFGVIEAAKRAEGRYVIWNYIDITDMAPEIILAVLRVNIDSDTYGAVKEFLLTGDLMPGVRSFGHANGQHVGLLWLNPGFTNPMFPDELDDKISTLSGSLRNGEITVPTVP